jgi:hypothetical protein
MSDEFTKLLEQLDSLLQQLPLHQRYVRWDNFFRREGKRYHVQVVCEDADEDEEEQFKKDGSILWTRKDY